MKASQNSSFNKEETLNALKHYLPTHNPLKDFIFQNTLKAFQNKKFHEALREASEILGYKVSYSLKEFRELYIKNDIRESILDKVISDKKGAGNLKEWKHKMVHAEYTNLSTPRIGKLRANWKRNYHVDLNTTVHSLLFRIICSYLDQGVSIWNFPLWENGLLQSIREMEQNSFSSFFKSKRAKSLLLSNNYSLEHLLKIVVGDESLYKHYLFDQQFAHPGWSGLVVSLEQQPQLLFDPKKVSVEEFAILELLLEIDFLDAHFGEGKWEPLCKNISGTVSDLFAAVPETELHEILTLWQDAFEWNYFDQVLAGFKKHGVKKNTNKKTFQAFFCLDDREISLRTYIEKFDPNCVTYGTPGFFNVEFYFKPNQGKFLTKLCPVPVTPTYLIKEIGGNKKREKEVHFRKETYSLFGGLFASFTFGFYAVFKLLLNIFKPTMSPTAASSFKHMNSVAKLSIENKSLDDRENNLQVGFTIEEMVTRVEGVLQTTGAIKDFASMIYVIGHGASSINNPFYTTMDCGACSCRPGSVNARVFCFMANHPKVRAILAERGLVIPEGTLFVGGLHDTTRDEIEFFDTDTFTEAQRMLHKKNVEVFEKALDHNAKERSRRFESVDTKMEPGLIRKKVQDRSVSLFETRPELDHATNALCIVGRREISKNLFLDRRAFLNSYDFKIDPEGNSLFRILKAATPVCGDINLTFFFSKVDTQKLGAGTKLPHNVMGLFGVSNGIEGDLRTGLPKQMIESHDPVRLLMVVEHYPEVVLNVIQRTKEMYEYYLNEWIHLAVINPDTYEISIYKDGSFYPYSIVNPKVEISTDLTKLIENSHCQNNIPVHILS